MKRKEGLSLVELIVAIGVFSIIMLALSGTIVNGLQVRRKNNAQAHAVAHANAIIEAYKNDWSNISRYTDYDPTNLTTLPARLPSHANLPFPDSGINVNADECGYYDTAIKKIIPYSDAATCTANKGGVLRFVTVTIEDAQGKELVNLTAEIGKPKL